MLLEKREYLSTTNLPFMNWYGGNVKEITKFKTGVIVTDIIKNENKSC